MKNLKNQELTNVILRNKICQLTCDVLCAHRCKECGYIEMDNDFWNDGTRRCDWRGEWVDPYQPACPYFK